MKVTHVLGKSTIMKDDCKDCSFLLTNRIGGYIWLNDAPTSRYQGTFFVENYKVYRVIENIGISGNVSEIINRFWCVERIKEKTTERFFMPYGHNSLIYETDGSRPIELNLDIKDTFINDIQGVYSIDKESEKNILIIKCKIKEETFYLAVKIDGTFKINNKFIERHYSQDENRKSPPFVRKVYNSAEINAHSVVISFSNDKQKALSEAEFIYKNIEKLKKIQLETIQKIASYKVKDTKINMAYNCARIMLYNLAVDDFGIYAGLPWFFQFWARDELISLKALKEIKGIGNLKEKIFDRWLEHTEKIGKMPAHITLDKKENGASADGFGWLFKRNSEIKISKERKEKIGRIADANPELFASDSLETWMDTIPRKGARIELQALKLNMFKEMHELTGSDIHKINEDILRKEVRTKFFNGSVLFDSPQDSTIRPNIFLAAYIYPELLKKEEWTVCFGNALNRLWCEWDDAGGVSSVDKTTPFFVDTYSGEDNRSYHNGDSWFWLNNLAAMVLWRNDREKFLDFVKKILQASVAEILWMGAVGNHSEISSAKQLSSCGCVAQSWSAAMFIEMVDEIFLENPLAL